MLDDASRFDHYQRTSPTKFLVASAFSLITAANSTGKIQRDSHCIFHHHHTNEYQKAKAARARAALIYPFFLPGTHFTRFKLHSADTLVSHRLNDEALRGMTHSLEYVRATAKLRSAIVTESPTKYEFLTK